MGVKESKENVVVIEITAKTLVMILATALVLGFLSYYFLSFFSPPSPELKIGDINVKPLSGKASLKGNITNQGNVSGEVYASYEINSTVCLVVGEKPVVGEWIIVEVRDPEGHVVWVDQRKTGKNGCIPVYFGLKPDAVKGKYMLYASCRTAKASEAFMVGG
ncbi:MAG: hypothetical protein DRJ37_04305 [Thermoprotei archaeon]|nr:MAG: hypothetical protein DRJ37_04305 [Thermoprotei archaeon]